MARILLVGFMGSGKSSVGSRLADRLGWTLLDVDAAVEEELGAQIARIFATSGESAFREAEDRITRAALREDRIVVATGGGWAAVEGRLSGLPPGSVSVWLDVGVDEVLRRIEAEPGRRPLLETDDPRAAAYALLATREERYAEATVRVDTDGRSVDDVTARIMEILASHGLEDDAE